jgi:hypothetical protein
MLTEFAFWQSFSIRAKRVIRRYLLLGDFANAPEYIHRQVKFAILAV